MTTQNANWKKVRVGSRIAVYFDDARCYYACKVLKKEDRRCKGADNASNFFLEYEDDSTEWKNLAKSKFRWQDFYVDTDDEGEEEAVCDHDNEELSEGEEESFDDGEVVDDNSDGKLVNDEAMEVDGEENEFTDDEGPPSDDDSSDVGAAAAKNDESSPPKTCNRKSKDKKKDVGKKEDGKESEDLNEEEENEDSDNLNDGDSDKESERPPPKKTNKRKSNASNARAPKPSKQSKKDSTKVVEDDEGSEATPTMQSEEDESNVVTPPPAKRTPVKNGAKKPAPKRNGRKTASPDSPDTKPSKKKRMTIKDVKKAHEKKETSKGDALLSVMLVHHITGTKSIAFETIVSDLGYKPKNKALEQTWKGLRSLKLVEGSGRGKKQVFQLTKKGINKIAPDEDYKDELANPPKTTSELQERIKANAVNEYGNQIFDFLLDAVDNNSFQSGSMSPEELATECGVKKDSEGFLEALEELKDNGYAIQNPKAKKKLLLSEKCFLD